MKFSATIRVILVSRHPIMLSGLERVISNKNPRMEVIKEFSLCSDLVSEVMILLPDVIVLDLDTYIDEGINAITLLNASSKAKILVLTGFRDNTVGDRAMLAGARGVLRKEEPVDTVTRAIEGVHADQFWLDRAGTSRLFLELSRKKSSDKDTPSQKRLKTLTTREIEVADCLTSNASESSKAIAKKLCISDSTLRNHLGSIYEKLGISSRVGLWDYLSKNKLNNKIASTY